MKSDSNIYVIYLIVIIVVNLSYRYVNTDNKIEYFFFTKDRVKYKTIKYCTIFLNIVMLIYLRFVLSNLINSYNTIK